jgi:hypothetical protein
MKYIFAVISVVGGQFLFDLRGGDALAFSAFFIGLLASLDYMIQEAKGGQ